MGDKTDSKKNNNAPLAACEYKAGRTLGSGSYGQVKEAIKISTGEKFAMKVISKKLMRGKEDLVMNEIKILKSISKDHPNIITLVDYFESPNNLYLIMDLCTGGELFDRIIEKGHFFEADAKKIIRTVLDAVDYIHKRNIVHRDIKPENLIFRDKSENSDLMIADFGLSKINKGKNERFRTHCGTPGYMAPEVIKKVGHGKEVDIWSCGVLCYFLLSGFLPFEDESNVEEIEKVLHCDYNFDDAVWKDVSDKAKDFIQKMLVLNPSDRISAEDALKHPWLVDNESLETKRDLLPGVREGFDAKRAFRGAVGAVQAAHMLSAHSSKTKVGYVTKNPLLTVESSIVSESSFMVRESSGVSIMSNISGMGVSYEALNEQFKNGNYTSTQELNELLNQTELGHA